MNSKRKELIADEDFTVPRERKNGRRKMKKSGKNIGLIYKNALLKRKGDNDGSK